MQARKGGTTARRNYNRGNFRESSAELEAWNNGFFASFSTRADGDAAHLRQVRLDAAKGYTISGLIYKYAPPTENDTERSSAVVTGRTGASRETRVSDLTPAQLETMMRAMRRMKAGVPES